MTVECWKETLRLFSVSQKYFFSGQYKPHQKNSNALLAPNNIKKTKSAEPADLWRYAQGHMVKNLDVSVLTLYRWIVALAQP